MSKFRETTTKKIDMIFVLALIVLFAATSFILVLIGAKQYRFVADVMNENYENRTTSSYLAEKIHQYDAKDAILVSDIDGVPALSITSVEGEASYVTYIYYYEGYLRELVLTESSVYSLSSGQEIIAMQGFTPELIGNSLIRTEVVDTKGEKQIHYFTLHSGIGKEGL